MSECGLRPTVRIGLVASSAPNRIVLPIGLDTSEASEVRNVSPTELPCTSPMRRMSPSRSSVLCIFVPLTYVPLVLSRST